jgi:hypothetical protein
MACGATSRCATKETLCASRFILPTAATPGAVTLGLRFPKNISDANQAAGSAGSVFDRLEASKHFLCFR